MTDPDELSRLAGWRPTNRGLRSEANEDGLPTVIHRTPTKIVEECERAFDEGLLLAALTLAVTIPDVCSRIAGCDYRKWSEDYLGLLNDGENRSTDRKKVKRQKDIDAGLEAMERRGLFTASDLYQLRCAVVHADSSVNDDEGAGAAYSPFRVIGICVQGDPDNLVSSYGHTGEGVSEQVNCAFDCVIRLEALISLVAKGVCRFIEEDPRRDREQAANVGLRHLGIVDFRSATQSYSC